MSKAKTVTHKKRHIQKRKASPLVKYLMIVIGIGVLLTASGFTFAATQEQHDYFCSSCHTQPESTYYQRTLATHPVDLASAHTVKQVRCIDCHSGTGVTGRVGAELLGAHNALAFYTGTAVQPAKVTSPIGDGNCLKCHAKVLVSRDMNNHFHFFLLRWQSRDTAAATCVSCHTGHATDGQADIAFLSQSHTVPVCDACHSALGEGE